jgi:uncharacterized membrane protein YGL010W
MEWNKIGRWILLLGSLVLGALAGWGGFVIFEVKVPAAMQTAMLSAEARLYYLVSGVAFGLLIFGWVKMCVWIAAKSVVARTKRELTAQP